MLSGYEKYGRFCDAVDVFEAMPEKNVMSYNVMLSGYLGIGDFMSAWKVFDEIGERNVASWNAMINGYVKVGRMREGCELFDEMSERNEVSYMIMISGRVGVSEFEEAWRWFVDMRRRGVMPDQNVFLVVLSVVIGLDNVVTLANLVTLAMKMGYSEDVVGTVIVNAFTLEDAVALYIQVPEQTVETQTAMMIAYAQSGRIVEARKVFNDIRNPNVLSWNALLAGYMHNGMIEEAKELFKQMPTRNVASWAAMIPGVVHNGQSEESLELMAQMHRLGNIPSNSSFTSALLACANVGDVEMMQELVCFYFVVASAVDLAFVQELLERSPLLEFGESEYGVTDKSYAAARSKSCDLFRVLLDFAITLMFLMMNRAIRAAARASNLQVLKELLADCCDDILAYRDIQGATPLHAAAGKGQVEV
ncbi:hypothetical protein CQW23_20668 [Capsicum baccatum]|uniref:Uncharacterized protein n=1 Tax=Capsicum baccatum TaxID=33114 RepID=A0A2G2W9A5_CAPBA|nr:hypothetical protein CQW23_20668 [Capsicum baccatum]